MYYLVAGVPFSDELYHYGTKGQKWGERNYQYEDGSLTPEGRKHYGVGPSLKEEMSNELKDYLVGRKKEDAPIFGGRRRSKYAMERRVTKLRKAANKAVGSKKEKLLTKMNAQKKKNEDYDEYLAKTSGKKILMQNILMGRTQSQIYRSSRARGASRLRSLYESSNGIGSVILRRKGNKKAYGANVL